MPIEQGAVNPVFFQHEPQFLAQGLVDWSGGPTGSCPANFNHAKHTQ
jgi:hypothetical protein